MPQYSVYEVMEGKRIEEMVEEMMRPHNIKVEVRNEGRWKDELCV